jgi:ADP-ribosylglycohydrolase
MTNNKRLTPALKSLLGTSIGDAFGDSFFGETAIIKQRIKDRELHSGEWLFTDDTIMSIAIYKSLEKFGDIHQDYLAQEFSRNYLKDNYRGYGGTAHFILRTIGEGQNWQEVAQNVFEGMGSMGNGAAMRAGVIGAYFADDIDKIKLAAEQSAKVTHAHFEASVGAMAVAIAAGLAQKMKENNVILPFYDFIRQIVSVLPASDTTSKINKSLSIPTTYSIETAVSILGNGIKMTAQDTVPFALWCAAQHLGNFEEALWKAVSGLGDRDTICAIVGSIVILSASETTIPQLWLDKVEKFEESVFWE